MAKPVRVAHVVGKMVGGGVEQVVMNYYRHIDRSRVQFDFLVDSDSTLVPKDEIESLGGRVFEIPPYQHQIAYQRELIRLFRVECWPVVHSHVNALSVFPLRAAKRAGVPVRIAHSHSTAGKGEHAKNAMKTVLKMFANVYPTHRFACGKLAGDWLFGNRQPYEIVRNAIDLDRFSFDDSVRKSKRAELDISESTLVVGHVGRFMPQKNHSFLIEAFDALRRERSDSMLLLAGEGELRRRMEVKVKEAGLESCVRFLGQRSDIAELYQAFDVFALPSLYEGLCVVGVEAQRAGLPCVFADTITREISLTDNAIFLPINNVEAWAEALQKRVESREVEMSSFGEYNISAAAKRLESMYAELIGGIEC